MRLFKSARPRTATTAAMAAKLTAATRKHRVQKRHQAIVGFIEILDAP